jgi:hypothetical protein
MDDTSANRFDAFIRVLLIRKQSRTYTTAVRL